MAQAQAAASSELLALVRKNAATCEPGPFLDYLHGYIVMLPCKTEEQKLSVKSLVIQIALVLKGFEMYNDHDGLLKLYRKVLHLSTSYGWIGTCEKLYEEKTFNKNINFHLYWAEGYARAQDSEGFARIWKTARDVVEFPHEYTNQQFWHLAAQFHLCVPELQSVNSGTSFRPKANRRRSSVVSLFGKRPAQPPAREYSAARKGVSVKERTRFMLRDALIESDVSIEEFRAARYEDERAGCVEEEDECVPMDISESEEEADESYEEGDEGDELSSEEYRRRVRTKLLFSRRKNLSRISEERASLLNVGVDAFMKLPGRRSGLIKVEVSEQEVIDENNEGENVNVIHEDSRHADTEVDLPEDKDSLRGQEMEESDPEKTEDVDRESPFPGLRADSATPEPATVPNVASDHFEEDEISDAFSTVQDSVLLAKSNSRCSLVLERTRRDPLNGSIVERIVQDCTVDLTKETEHSEVHDETELLDVSDDTFNEAGCEESIMSCDEHVHENENGRTFDVYESAPDSDCSQNGVPIQSQAFYDVSAANEALNCSTPSNASSRNKPNFPPSPITSFTGGDVQRCSETFVVKPASRTFCVDRNGRDEETSRPQNITRTVRSVPGPEVNDSEDDQEQNEQSDAPSPVCSRVNNATVTLVRRADRSPERPENGTKSPSIATLVAAVTTKTRSLSLNKLHNKMQGRSSLMQPTYPRNRKTLEPVRNSIRRSTVPCRQSLKGARLSVILPKKCVRTRINESVYRGDAETGTGRTSRSSRFSATRLSRQSHLKADRRTIVDVIVLDDSLDERGFWFEVNGFEEENSVLGEQPSVVDAWGPEIRKFIMGDTRTQRLHRMRCELLDRPRVGHAIEIGGEKFQILDEIYCSETSRVCKALDEEENVFALKFGKGPAAHWTAFTCENLRERIPEELHDMVLLLDDAYIYQNCGVLVHEYLPMGNLLELCNKYEGRLINWQIGVFLSINLLRILNEVHSRGFIHCGVNPENLLFTDKLPDCVEDLDQLLSTNVLRLIDWGLSIDTERFDACPRFSDGTGNSVFECPNMRDGREWSFEPDYFGFVATMHCVFFNEHIIVEKADDDLYYPLRAFRKNNPAHRELSGIFEELINLDLETESPPEFDRMIGDLTERFKANFDKRAWVKAVGELNVFLTSD